MTDGTNPANPADLLKALILSGSTLAGLSKSRTEDSSKTLIDVIKARLHELNHAPATMPDLEVSSEALESNNLEELKFLTAIKSLEVLEKVQLLLQEYDVDLPANNKDAAGPQGESIISTCIKLVWSLQC
jgi:hypothetical protein